MAQHSAEDVLIEQVVDRLSATFPQVPSDTVTSVVARYHSRFDGRPLREFVPLFVERGSRRELAKLTP